MSCSELFKRIFQGCCLLFNYQGSLCCCRSRDSLFILSQAILLCQQLFSFFIFHVVLSAHNQVAVLTTKVIISRHFGIVNNVFAFYLFQTIRTICIEVQPGASNRQNNRELAHIVVLSVRSIWRSAAARIRCRTADSSCMAELHTSEL